MAGYSYTYGTSIGTAGAILAMLEHAATPAAGSEPQAMS